MAIDALVEKLFKLRLERADAETAAAEARTGVAEAIGLPSSELGSINLSFDSIEQSSPETRIATRSRAVIPLFSRKPFSRIQSSLNIFPRYREPWS